MASKYKRHSTGGRFKQRGASDLGSGAIKTQADIVIDSLKLQRARTSEYASDYVQGMKGVENTEEWNQNLLNDLEDKAYQTRREAIKVRQKREVESLEGKAKEYGKQAEYWKDFSTTYSQQWGKLAEGVTDLGLRVAADKELERLKEDKIFTLENLEALVDEGMSSDFDANHKDPKALNTLTKLFNSRNHHLRKGILRELNVQLPSIILELEEKIKEDPESQWTPATIQEHFNTLGKGLVRKFDLGNTREGKSLLATFNKHGYLKAEYDKNIIEVGEDEESVLTAATSLKAALDSDVYYATDDLGLDYDDENADPTVRGGGHRENEILVLKQNFLAAISSQKRKVGDKFVIGYSDPREAIVAGGQTLVPYFPDRNEFVDLMVDFPTPGNSKQTFGQRNKEPAALAKLQKDFADTHKDFWEKEKKDKADEEKIKDANNVLIIRDRIKNLDPGDIQVWIKELTSMRTEFPGELSGEEISKALLFNFPSKNGILINDDLTKAGNEADLKRMESIYPYLPKDLQKEWDEVRTDIELQSTVTDSTKLKADATKAIKQINDQEGLNPTSDDSTNDAIRAWVQTYQLSWRDTRGKKGLSAQERHSIAKEYANNAAETNAGLFRRGKNAYGNMDWLAFVDENNKWGFFGRKKDVFGRGLNETQLEHKLANMTPKQLLKDPRLGSREGIGGYSVAPLDEFDKIEKTIVTGGVYSPHENFVKIWRSQSGDPKTWKSLTDIINELRAKTVGGDEQWQLEETDILQPGMLEKATYEVTTSKINFPDYVYNTPLDRIAIGIFANMSKDEDFRMENFFDKNVTSTLEEASLAGLDPIDYITQGAYAYDPAIVFTQPKPKSGIDPNSIPGRVLKQRYEDSKAGKIQRGSRSYQLPDHTRAREIDGKILSYDEYKGMPFYIKILEEAGRLDEIEKIRGTK